MNGFSLHIEPPSYILVHQSVRPSLVRPPICYQLVKMFITLESHGIIYHILHTYACQHPLTTDMRSHPFFFIDMGLLSNFPACCGQLVNSSLLLNLIGYFDQILHTYLF